jgi:hypothetical protein
VRALPSVEDMDLHALADEGKQGGEGFVECHADAITSGSLRWAAATEARLSTGRRSGGLCAS